MTPFRIPVFAASAVFALSAATPAALADHNENVSAVVTFYLSDEELEEDQDQHEELVRYMAKLEAQNKCVKQDGVVQTTNFEELFPGWSGTGACHPSGPDTSGFYPRQATRARCTGTYTVRCRVPDIKKATDDFVKAVQADAPGVIGVTGPLTQSAVD